MWGAAYELVGSAMIHEALDHLGVRECLIGGYITVMAPFQDRDTHHMSFPVLLFTATKDNSLFMGPASLDDLAHQISGCRGPCGHNIEYVTRLAHYMKEHIPEEKDEHLFGLVQAIKDKLGEQGLDIDTVIYEAKCHRVPASSVCSKCNALCSEYAFCSKCRSKAIKEALTCSQTGSANEIVEVSPIKKPGCHNRMREKLIVLSTQ